MKFTRLNDFLADFPKTEINETEEKFLDQAVDLAFNNTCYDKATKVGAVIFTRKKLISTGVNKVKTNPFQAKWNSYSSCLHAEMDALLSAVRQKDIQFNKCTIAIGRIARLRKPSSSYPCKYCWAALCEIGIGKIVCYGVDDEKVALDFRK